MVTMSREPIEKSCSSKHFQYSQETIKTLQNIMREVASKKRPNVSIKRRKLTGWNIFTKRKSLESMLRREFVDDNEFIGYVIDNEEFKYRSKERRRNRMRMRVRMNVGVADKLSTGSIRKEFNNLTLDKRYFYDELANALTKLRDEEMKRALPLVHSSVWFRYVAWVSVKDFLVAVQCYVGLCADGSSRCSIHIHAAHRPEAS